MSDHKEGNRKRDKNIRRENKAGELALIVILARDPEE